METELMAVATFHEKMRISPSRPVYKHSLDVLYSSSADVKFRAEILQDFGKHDERYNRMHLIFEEAGELGIALAEGNEIKALDGLTDLLYVVLGTAIAFDWPLAEAFAEVHKSNMTKERQYNDPAGHRVRDKGPYYVPPDLQTVLADYRAQQKQEDV